ncbi:MAG: rhodanese-like domain-containing protein [Verrucomicrobiales bacterium]|nr:rhodanese-like domain-containing protein [Verrucomicrobiales bacterium]
MKSLVLLLLGLGLASFSSSAQIAAPASPVPATAAAPRNVSPAEFDKLRGGTNTVVLDVRTPVEYAEGHLPDAKLLDYRSANFAAEVAKLDKSKTYLVHCAAGGRSAKACTKMISLGFTNVVNLDGGLGAWTDAGKPLVK